MNLLFFIFCFSNLYGPLSTNITFAFNVLLFFAVYSKQSRVAYERIFVIIPFLLLLLAIASFLLTRSPFKDYSVIGLYLRMLVNCAIFPAIMLFFYQKKTRILRILSLTLFLHCLMVLIQMIFPDLQDFNIVLFRFARDAEILENLTMRRLGLTGSYDTSGLYTAISAVLAIELSLLTSKKKYRIMSVVSLVASFFTSRTGMVLAVLIILLCIVMNLKTKTTKKRSSFPYIVIIALSLFYFILPLLLSTMGYSSYSSAEYEGVGYGSGTSERLFEYHLLPLEKLTTRELIWGYGCEVRKSTWLLFSSDIGYVRQIYEVGIVGVVLMVLFCVMMTIKTFRRYKIVKNDLDTKIGAQLMWILLVSFLIFDYKCHALYNVCVFEVFLFVYYYYYCRFITLKGIPGNGGVRHRLLK